MDDVERALSQIAEIRARMSASSRFRGFAPEAMAFNAALSLAATLAQLAWPERLAGDGVRYIAFWGAVLSLATLVSATEASACARRVPGGLGKTLLGAMVRGLLPFGAAGVVIAVAVCRFAPAEAWMVPGVWQILVGLAGFAAAASLPRAIEWAAAWYFVCGAVVLALGAGAGALSPWMMGLPFTVGLALVALILHRSNGDRDVVA